MNIESPAFDNGGSIPSKYTCDGEEVSPPLKFSDIPEGTKTLALIAEDPDVPTNLKPDGLWTHWLVWNMSPDTTEIPEGQNPQGVIGKNTSGKVGYQGPCPPDGKHRYFFKLYALDEKLTVDPEETDRDALLAAMEDHILAHTEIMGTYEKQ